MTTINTASLVWHNGSIVQKEKLNLFFDVSLFMSTNLVEIFFTNGTDILFAEETIARIKSLITIYQFNSQLFADGTGELFKNEIRRLLIRNFHYKTGRCFLLLCEGKSPGETDEFIFLEPCPDLFSSEKILKRAVVSSKFLKPDGNVMHLPTIEHEFRKIIKSEITLNGTDDCIILNQEQNITESYHGNIFLIDGQTAMTPSPKSGCSLHLLREVVIAALQTLSIKVTETEALPVEALFDAKEVIIAGPSGIYSLKGVEYKRYFDTIRTRLTERIISGL